MAKKLWRLALALVMALTLCTAAWAEGESVKEVGTADTLKAAIETGTEEVVKLTADITITAGLKIERDVIVDLNGCVLRYGEAANPDSIFHVAGGNKLTMTDSRPTAKHKDTSLPAGGLITGGKGFAHDNGAGQSFDYFGGGVYVESDATFVLEGGTIYACGVQSGASSAYGGGIYCKGGSVTMSGGAIRNCVVSANSSANGGGIYLKRDDNGRYPSFTMTGGVIADCSAMYGGGIAAAPCAVQITGGRIENCEARERGGGLSIGGYAGGETAVLDAVISGCEAKKGGGVALIGFAKLELRENARITNCTAAKNGDDEEGTIEYGAAIYMDLDDPNTTNHPGSFLYANGGRVEGSVYVGTNRYDCAHWIKATNAIDHTDGQPSTVFTGDVYCEGDIRGGSFYGSVTVPDPDDDMSDPSTNNYWKFCSNLSGGSFYGPVSTECHVSGGTYYGGLKLEKNAKLSGKPMDTKGVLNDQINIPNPEGEPVTVTYAYGELGGTYATQIVQQGEKAARPTDPTREGYTFGGWYRDAACTEVWDHDTTINDALLAAATDPAGDGAEVEPVRELTLYAKWTETPTRYYYSSGTGSDDGKKDETKGSPKTFDAGAGVYAVTAVLSLTGMAYVGKKKF